MKRIIVNISTLIALFGSSVLVASSAQAKTSGPIWITTSSKTELKAGESKELKSVGSSAFKLVTANHSITCKELTKVGTIVGGDPGTGHSTMLFTGCAYSSSTVAECGATSPGLGAGEIKFEVQVALAYEQGTELMAYDTLYPAKSSSEFVKFELSGSNCPSGLDKTTVTLEAAGTLVTEPIKEARCGTAAKLGATAELTTPGVVSKVVSLKFPPPANAEIWESGKGKFAVVECSLKAFGETAKLEGEVKVETTPSVEFGWEKL